MNGEEKLTKEIGKTDGEGEREERNDGREGKGVAGGGGGRS